MAGCEISGWPSLADLLALNVENMAGSLLIGVFISAIIFGASTSNTFQYFVQFPGDKITLKFLVAAIWLLELGHVTVSFHYMYSFVANELRRAEGKLFNPNPPQTVAVSLLLAGITVPTIQMFFGNRVRTIGASKSAFFIQILCCMASIAVFALSCVIGSRISANPLRAVLGMYTINGVLVTATLGTSASVDVILAAALCYYLRRISKGRGTLRLAVRVKNITIWAIETGLVTSFAALLLLASFVLLASSYAWQGIYIFVTRAHALSFLVSLNSRGNFRPGLYTSTLEPPERSIRFQHTQSRTMATTDLETA